VPYVLVPAGVVIVLAVAVDALLTTVSVHDGGGPIAGRIARLVRHLVVRAGAGRRRGVLHRSGVVVLVATVAFWVVGLWVGWTLIFVAGGAVELSPSGEEAGVADTVYFVGMVLVTLGTGDLVAATPFWRVLSVVCSFGGLVLITLAVTYLLSVVSAVVDHRALATRIASLGRRPAEILTTAWRGDRFDPVLDSALRDLAAALATVAEQRLAYPVIDQFATASPRRSLAVGVARLSEAVDLAESLPDAGGTLSPITLGSVRSAVAGFLEASDGRSGHPHPPPAADITAALAAGVPLPERVTDHAGSEAPGRAEHRRRLRAVVDEAGWSWSDVDPAATP
jgi:hypothetical protein